MKVQLFHHVVDLPNSEQILLEQIERIKKSKFLDLDSLYHICINGDLSKFNDLIVELKNFKNIKFVQLRNDCTEFEFPTLTYIKEIVDNEQQESYVGYIHMKGSSQVHSVEVQDWRKLLEYFIIDKHLQCINELGNGIDIVGVNFIDAHIGKHFSGNFWWARSKYLKTLPHLPLPRSIDKGKKSPFTNQIYTDSNWRYDHEKWITSGSYKHKELFNSRINHYTTRFPSTFYHHL